MVREHRVDAVGDVTAGLGEGPCWDAATETLLWVDIPGGKVHRTDPESGHTDSLDLGPPVSLALPTSGGDVLVAAGNRLVTLSGDTVTETVAEIPPLPSIRFNDGRCDPRGRLLIGSMHTEKRPGTAALYRLEPDRTLTTVVAEVTVSNGLGWSPDGSTLYYVDTPRLCVEMFDYDVDTASVSGHRPFVDLAGVTGRPDGLAVDADGGVWVALIAGGALHRYTVDGRLDRIVPLPVSHPTSCAFGGDDLTDLYVTTASEPLSPPEHGRQPLAGRLLHLRPGVAGLPSVPLA